MQHHALARLALALAPMRPTPLRPLHQPRRVQLRLHPGVAPLEIVVAHQVLVKMLHVPAPVTVPVQLQHQPQLPRRHPLRRRLAQPPVDQPLHPVLLVAVPIAPELPLRHPQQLARLQHRQSPRSQRLKTSRNFCILRSCSHVARFIVPAPAQGTKPDNSCAT